MDDNSEHRTAVRKAVIVVEEDEASLSSSVGGALIDSDHTNDEARKRDPKKEDKAMAEDCTVPSTHGRSDSLYSVDSFVMDAPVVVAVDDEDDDHSTTRLPLTLDTNVSHMAPTAGPTAAPTAAPMLDGNSHNNNKNNNTAATNATTTAAATTVPSSPQHETIDVVSMAQRNQSGDESATPVNPFFQGLYDSDGNVSDGSIVFQTSSPRSDADAPAANLQLLSQQASQPPFPVLNKPVRRDRFPSFDSVGSSGSVVRKVIGPRSGSTKPSSASTPNAVVNIQSLPYHERRRILQQRQKQEQKQPQRSTGKDPTPPRPGQPRGPYPPPPQNFYPPFPPPQFGGTFPPGPPPPPHNNHNSNNHNPYPPPPGMSYPHAAAYGQQLLSQPPPPHFHPHAMPPPPPFQQQPQSQDSSRQPPSQQQLQQQMHPYPPMPPPGQSLRPPKQRVMPPPPPPPLHSQAAPPRTTRMSGISSHGDGLQRAWLSGGHSSFDSYDDTTSGNDNDNVQNSGISGGGGGVADSSQRHEAPNDTIRGGPPRPTSSRRRASPPPPAPTGGAAVATTTTTTSSTHHSHSIPPATHVRQDSTGSVSSLGSYGQSGKEDNHSQYRASASMKPSFFDRLNPFSSSPPPTREHDVSNFHRKNQAFLNKVVLKSPNRHVPQSPSPRTMQRRTPTNHHARRQPPPSRGGHRRLNSIENDDWTEHGDEENDSDDSNSEAGNAYATARTAKKKTSRRKHRASGRAHGGLVDDQGSQSSDDDNFQRTSSGNHTGDWYDGVTERSRLLPAAGISTNEYSDSKRHTAWAAPPHPNFDPLYHDNHMPSGRQGRDTSFDHSRNQHGNDPHARYGTHGGHPMHSSHDDRSSHSRRRKKHRKKSKRRSRDRRSLDSNSSESSYSSSTSTSASVSSHEYSKWKRSSSQASYIARERELLKEKWRAELREETLRNRWDKRSLRYLSSLHKRVAQAVYKKYTWTESFVANLPMTIGAIALSTANLGVDWFKFAEENMATCEPVHFHSAQCTFPEFPGCFYCDTHAKVYEVAVNFHFGCSCLAAVFALSLIGKLVLARRVVFDELSSPTTAAPAGLLCMTLDVVFAGRGMLGMVVVCGASFVHLCLAIWFMYMALAYHIMPEPSWFPNTTGIGISAVKLWLYYPMAGHFLMAISLSLNFFFFPVSLFRVMTNRKISPTTGWMQMSAPNLSLYSLTIMAQPSFQEENPDINSFQQMHRLVYLPCMHVLFSLCIVGMIASVSSLAVRWDTFRKQPFSSANAAFCAPCLSHANAIQAYRAAVNSFSDLSSDSPYLIFLYTYWVFVLIGGTGVTLVVATRYLMHLPEWTHLDLEGEIEPPAPYETSMTMMNMISSGETLVQPFVSPAILQANETGTLVFTRDSAGHKKFVRTRKVTALGFEPVMDLIEMEQERELLLDWVGKNAPRRRHRTLSVPGIDFSYGSGGSSDFGSRNTGVYGMEAGLSPAWARRGRAGTEGHAPRRQRSNTLSPAFRGRTADT